MQTTLLTPPLDNDARYELALELVHAHRAASVALLERHLRMQYEEAEQLMARMARDTDFVHRMPSGLYLYTPNTIGGELAALRDFALVVIQALQAGLIDADVIRAEALRLGLATEALTTCPCSPTCACAPLLDFPVRCFRPVFTRGIGRI